MGKYGILKRLSTMVTIFIKVNIIRLNFTEKKIHLTVFTFELSQSFYPQEKTMNAPLMRGLML